MNCLKHIKMDCFRIVFIVLFIRSAFAATSQTQTGGLGNIGFFHDYLIEPFLPIKRCGVLFHGEYGLSIILVTIIVRIVVLPLFVNQFKKQRVFQEKWL